MSLEILLEQKPSCVECRATESTFWHRNASGEIVCDSCQSPHRDPPAVRSSRSQGLLSLVAAVTARKDADESRTTEGSAARSGTTRKSSRLKPSGRSRQGQNVIKPSATKGRSRRLIFKKNPTKAITASATIVSSEYVFYEGSYWQIGDVVSVTDVVDGLTYYAQLRGFLEDQYCNKSAVITWLIPKSHSGIQKLKAVFDPAAYTAGPEEDLPRDMSHFQFVCHAPSDYFVPGLSHRSYVASGPRVGCIWTSLGPEIQPIESQQTDKNCSTVSPLKPESKCQHVGKVDGNAGVKLEKESAKKFAVSSKERIKQRKASVRQTKQQ